MHDEHPKCKVQTIEYIIDTHDQESNDWNFAMNFVITKNEKTEKRAINIAILECNVKAGI